MMLSHMMVALLLLSSLSSVSAVTTASHQGMQLQIKTNATKVEYENPIRKVVQFLEALQVKSDKTGKADWLVYKEVNCKCIKDIAAQQAIVDEKKARIDELRALIAALEAEKEQLDQEIYERYWRKVRYENALKKATELRMAEAEKNNKTIKDWNTNIDAMELAKTELREGLGDSFLQTQSAAVLRNIIVNNANIS